MRGLLLILAIGFGSSAWPDSPVSADSINPNADGSFSINKPKILFNGDMVLISGNSDDSAVCKYFGYNSSGIDRATLQVRGDKVDVLPDGSIVASSSLYALNRLNCRQ